VTRSGGNDFTVNGYHYYSERQAQLEHLVERPQRPPEALKQNQIGGRAGGPIV
jgi:hypothetical protein